MLGLAGVTLARSAFPGLRRRVRVILRRHLCGVLHFTDSASPQLVWLWTQDVDQLGARSLFAGMSQPGKLAMNMQMFEMIHDEGGAATRTDKWMTRRRGHTPSNRAGTPDSRACTLSSLARTPATRCLVEFYDSVPPS